MTDTCSNMNESPEHYTKGKKPISNTMRFHLYNNAKWTNYRSGEQIPDCHWLETGQGMELGRKVHWREVGVVTKEQYEGKW